MVGTNFDVFGWTVSNLHADYRNSGYSKPRIGNVLQTQVVFQKYLDIKAAAEKRASDKADQDAIDALLKKAGRYNAKPTTDSHSTDTQSKKEGLKGAAAITSYAAAFIITVYALAF